MKKQTRRELAKKYGISYNTLNGRLGLGWSLRKALTYPLNYKKGLKAKAEQAGIPYGTFRDRVQQGWSIEKAMSTPVHKSKYKYAELARGTAIQRATLYSRIKNYGWTLEKALKAEVKVRFRPDFERGVKRCSKCKVELDLKTFFIERKLKNKKSSIYPECRICRTINHKARMRRYRLEIVAHYSNGANKCALCPEARIEVLNLDHINGGGNRERKLIQGKSLWKFLQDAGYPPGYRILCRNCDWLEWIKRKEALHGRKREEAEKKTRAAEG